MLIITFDLETAIPGSFGDQKAGKCGISVACTAEDFAAWSFPDDRVLCSVDQKQELWDGTMLEELAFYLEEADLVVTWNGILYDIPVLSALLGRRINLNGHYDILDEIWKNVPRKEKGWSLDKIAQETLGRGKNGKGVSAPHLFQSGQIAKLFTYCMEDVALTRDLFYTIQRGEPLGGLYLRRVHDKAEEEEA